MKKTTVSLVLCFVLILAACIPCAAGIKPGNMNPDTDADITVDDARIALRIAVKLETADETQKTAGDVNKDGEITVDDARLILRVAVKLEDESVLGWSNTPVKAENVDGYPETKEGKVFHAFFINGERADYDVYTYGDKTDVYMPIFWVCCNLGISPYSVSKNGNTVGAFAARINGSIAVNCTEKASTTVDSEEYPDAKPEYYDNDYHCTYLLLNKTLGATLEFSPDKSAVYLTTAKPVNEKKSECPDFELETDGSLKYNESYTGGDSGRSEEPSSKKNNEPSSVYTPTQRSCPSCSGMGRMMCSSCGGRGSTPGVRMQFDPITMRSTYVPCNNMCYSCAGTGFRTCQTCGGSGRVMY